MAAKTPRRRPPITKWFTHWRELKDQSDVTTERQTEFRDKLKDAVSAFGEEDSDGNYWYTLPTPVEFKTHDGKVQVFTKLKVERYLTPKDPIPDPELTLDLLQKKGLWLNAADQKALQGINDRHPFALVTLDIDADAVADAWFRKVFTTEEYEGVLQDQTENFRFKPVE